MTDLTFHKPARRRVRWLIRAIVWLTTLARLRHRFTDYEDGPGRRPKSRHPLRRAANRQTRQIMKLWVAILGNSPDGTCKTGDNYAT